MAFELLKIHCMNLFRAIVYTSVVLSGFLIACSNSSTAPTVHQEATPSETDQSTKLDTHCPMPSIFKIDTNLTQVSLNQLKANLGGQYVLDEIFVYQEGIYQEGKTNGAFFGRVTRFATNSSFKGSKNIRDTKMKIVCKFSDREATVPFVSAADLTVASVVHLPSGRITVFDAHEGSYDNPQFNFPSLVDVHFDSRGNMSYKNFPRGKVVGPPYLTNLTLYDWLKILPGDVQFFVRDGAHFEMRFSQQQPRNLAVPDKEFTAKSTVRITYKQD